MQTLNLFLLKNNTVYMEKLLGRATWYVQCTGKKAVSIQLG